MTTNQTVDKPALESKATAEQQAAAEKIGWIPPTRFTGDIERFVDADEYIKRGETVLPIVKQREKALRDEITQIRTELTKRDKLLQEATDAIAEMQERHTVETQRRVEEARIELKAQLKQAKKDQDIDAEVEITDQLTQLDKAQKEETKVAKPNGEAKTFEPPPEIVEFQRQNTWFGKDRRKTAIAVAAAEELRASGDTSVGDVFFKKILDVVEEVFPPEHRPDKVEGGARNSGGGGGSGNGKSFADLPTDAKTQCHKDAKEFVGKGKRYETVAQWEKRYAELYFTE